MKFAGFWIRFLAHMIDGFITTIISLMVFLIGMALFFNDLSDMNMNGDNFTLHNYFSLFLLDLLALAVVVVYSAVFESSKWQATPGKKAVGIIVTDLNGERISLARAFCRYFAKLLSFMTFFVGFLISLFTKKKQALHDKIAGTLVLVKPAVKIEYNPKKTDDELKKDS